MSNKENIIVGGIEIPPLNSFDWDLISSRRRDIGYTDAAVRQYQHAHPHREITVYLRGEREYTLCGRTFHVTPGTIVLVDGNEPHFPGPNTDGETIIYLTIFFGFTTRLASYFCWKDALSSGRRINRNLFFDNALRLLIDRRWDAMIAENVCSREGHNFFLLPLLNYLFNETEFLLDHQHANSAKQAERIIAFVQEYIQKQNGRDCSLAKLEELCGYEKCYLSHLFHVHTGESIRKCIERCRRNFVESAEKAGKKQKEIADELGFSSPAAFWNWKNRKPRSQQERE